MTELKTRFEFIYFKELPQTGKTCPFSCHNNKTGEVLGLVRWYGPWRQYCFLPCEGSAYSVGCLWDVAKFIEGLRKEIP